MRTSFKLLDIVVHGIVFTVNDLQMSKDIDVKISSFDLVCILRYNVIGVIYMYIYEKVFDMDL